MNLGVSLSYTINIMNMSKIYIHLTPSLFNGFKSTTYSPFRFGYVD